MPEAALVVGENRIDCGKIEIKHFLAGVALVVLGDEIRQRAGDRRAVALGEVAYACGDRLLRLDQAFLRVGLVVERNDLDLLAEDAALGVQLVGDKLKYLQVDLADAGAAARKRVDQADLDGILCCAVPPSREAIARTAVITILRIIILLGCFFHLLRNLFRQLKMSR